MREADSFAVPTPMPKLVNALLYLAKEGLLSIRQRDQGTGPVLFDEQRANDEFYENRFFGQGAFELKLTHKRSSTASALCISTMSSRSMGSIASRGGIPLIDQGVIIGAIGCSEGTDSQDVRR